MTKLYEIRAKYTKDTIVMYQAYPDEIADIALKKQKFVAPFSFQRMTWIKPSFLWLMHRSNWGQKTNQERTLAVYIKRQSWEKALSLGVLTSPETKIYGNNDKWQQTFDRAHVHIQWDTERSFTGAALNYYSIQVGLTRHIVKEFVEDWIVRLEDKTPLVQKLYKLKLTGGKDFSKLLPQERIYPIENQIGFALNM